MNVLWLALIAIGTTAGIRAQDPAASPVPETAAELMVVPENTQRVPVEVLAKGSKPQWVMVQVQTIPEPSAAALVGLTATCLLLFRRRGAK